MILGCIIWDFDDTLVETAVYFEEARKIYSELMADMGFPMDKVLEVLNRKDIENVNQSGGYYKNCFPNAMVQTYLHFCTLEDTVPESNVVRKVENLGLWVYDQKPVPVTGAEEVLQEIGRDGRFEMILATKGDPDVQWKRINQSGIGNFFGKKYVLRNKNKHIYTKIACSNGAEPRNSWLVGNSIKSDINPGISAGFNCIFVPNPYTWDYEMEEPKGKFITLKGLEKIPELILG